MSQHCINRRDVLRWIPRGEVANSPRFPRRSTKKPRERRGSFFRQADRGKRLASYVVRWIAWMRFQAYVSCVRHARAARSDELREWAYDRCRCTLIQPAISRIDACYRGIPWCSTRIARACHSVADNRRGAACVAIYNERNAPDRETISANTHTRISLCVTQASGWL